MKIALCGITFLLFALISTFSHANERPLLGKYNTTGYTHPDESVVESCEAYQGGYILKVIRKGSEYMSTEQFPLNMEVEELKELILKASSEELTRRYIYICDAPETEIYAFGPAEIGAQGTLTLFKSSGCGFAREEREGESSRKLVEIVTEHCPKIHDFNPDSNF